MSASNTARRSNKETNAPQADAPQADAQQVAPQADAAGTVTASIDGTSITLPAKFSPGMPLTANQATILNAAYVRQFNNNQTANAKARADRFAKATTDAERAANAPLSPEDYAKIWTDYEPSVGGVTRLSTMERMRLDAAWRFWVELVTAHNAALAKGEAPIIARALKDEVVDGKPTGNKVPARVTIENAPRKEAGQSDEAHKAAVEAFHEGRDAFKAKLLTMPAYADGIQRHLDAMLAEKGAAKAEAKTDAPTVAADVDLLG